MERRLVAILAADVVGYSRLMEADEEATARTLSTYREIIDGLVVSHHVRVLGSDVVLVQRIHDARHSQPPAITYLTNGGVCSGHHARALIWIKCLFEPG